MIKCIGALILFATMTTVATSQTRNPFLGRWDFNVMTPAGNRGTWLGVVEKNGVVQVWHQPTGGNVLLVDDVTFSGSHMRMVSPATPSQPLTIWELDVDADRVTGVQRRGDVTTPLTGVRAPELRRQAPAMWTTPEPLFNGRTLDGWVPMGNNSQWTVKDCLLVNQAKGANLKSTRVFDDFKLHFEVNCPDDANSGFYLRGRYEVQIESEPLDKNPPERRIGSIYGRIAPSPALTRQAGAWQTFDITLVGRTVTIVHNGVTTVDRKEIEGITGGALDANEAEPGPFYIQGDHTGGLQFRHITVSVPAT